MTSPNFANRTLWTGDNLDILRGMNSECVDLIYLDPPFISNQDYAAPVGSAAAGAEFKDTWTLSDVDDAWHGMIADSHPALYGIIDAARPAHGKGMKSYLIRMAVRMLELHRVLKLTGSIYLHCDDVASHYLKLLMDAIFDKSAYRNTVVWKRVSNHNDAGRFGRTADYLLFYGTSIRRQAVRVPLSNDNVASKYRHRDNRGLYRRGDLTGAGVSEGEAGEPWRSWDPTDIGRHWSVPLTGQYAEWIDNEVIPGYKSEPGVLERLDMLEQVGLIAFTAQGTPELKRYLNANPGQVPPDVWTDIPPVNSQAQERTGYPTQKPLALLERIINASSNEGDIVLDPFCGCATALVAAEKLERQWAGIDLSPKAKDLVELRLRKDLGLFGLQATYRDDVPRRTDQGQAPPYRTQKNTLYGKQEGLCAGLPDTVSLPQSHHRPHHPAVAGRHGPPGKPATAVSSLQLDEGRQAHGIPAGSVEGNEDRTAGRVASGVTEPWQSSSAVKTNKPGSKTSRTAAYAKAWPAAGARQGCRGSDSLVPAESRSSNGISPAALRQETRQLTLDSREPSLIPISPPRMPKPPQSAHTSATHVETTGDPTGLGETHRQMNLGQSTGSDIEKGTGPPVPFSFPQSIGKLRPSQQDQHTIICPLGEYMNQTIVMPIGIIEEPASAGATFRLTPQGQQAGLKTDEQVTIWRYHPEQLAMAKYAGRITRIGNETATFSILRAEVDERWPAEINPLEPGAPVYLARKGSFEPDVSRTAVTIHIDEADNRE